MNAGAKEATNKCSLGEIDYGLKLLTLYVNILNHHKRHKDNVFCDTRRG